MQSIPVAPQRLPLRRKSFGTGMPLDISLLKMPPTHLVTQVGISLQRMADSSVRTGIKMRAALMSEVCFAIHLVCLQRSLCGFPVWQ